MQSLPFAPSVFVVGHWATPSGNTRLLTYPSKYSADWTGGSRTTYVVVGGFRNAWLTRSIAGNRMPPRYLTTLHDFRDQMSLAPAMVLIAGALWRERRRRRCP